jgi:hypothetical protein
LGCAFWFAKKLPLMTVNNGSIPGIDRIGQQAANNGTSSQKNACHEAGIRTLR